MLRVLLLPHRPLCLCRTRDGRREKLRLERRPAVVYIAKTRRVNIEGWCIYAPSPLRRQSETHIASVGFPWAMSPPHCWHPASSSTATRLIHGPMSRPHPTSPPHLGERSELKNKRVVRTKPDIEGTHRAPLAHFVLHSPSPAINLQPSRVTQKAAPSGQMVFPRCCNPNL